MIYPLSDQIAEVRREIKQRERVYGRWVAEGRMKEAAASLQLGRMRAVLATLEACQAGTPPSPDPTPPTQGDFLNG